MKVLLTLLFIPLVGSYSLSAQNLIPNGGFENDLANWWTDASNGSTASFSVITADAAEGRKALKVDVITPGANAWDVQAINDAWPSETGETYTLTFWAKADAPGSSFKTIMQIGGSYSEKIFTLSDTWEAYEWAFTAQADDLELKLHFPNAGTFYIDGLNIPDDSGEEEPETEELVLNGGFEEGSGDSFTHWWFGTGSGSATFTEETADVVEGSRALQVTVNALGDNPWDIQAVNDAWPSEAGEGYTLRFWAKADAPGRSFKAVMQIGSSYAEQIFTLSDTWQQYEWVFTAQASNLELKFQFLSTGTFYLDEVSIPGEVAPVADEPLLVEAESGTPAAPSDPSVFGILTEENTTFVRVQEDFVATAYPGHEAHVISYTVEFPRAGTYDLYLRLRVGAGNFSDDSFYYGNGFGEKDVANGDDWITVNGLATGGHADADEIVTGGGNEANQVWKWMKLSDFAGQGEAPVQFVVSEGDLTHTFQIGSRENGLDVDKFAFGPDGVYYTVANLDHGEAGTTTPPPPPFTPTGPPIAEGQEKFLGNVYSNAQLPYFENYWNQVTPENAGKWGSVEATRDEMNWTQLDAAYDFAKSHGFPFRFHVLIWGNQQPAWIEDLPADEQLEEIEEWFSLVAQRYPDMDFVEVVNEPLHDPPNQPGNGGGNYIEALGGSGDTGWDWVLTAFRMAREYFPTTPLMINDYSIVNDGNATQTYIGIIELLKAEGLIDVIGVQGHAFSTRGSVSTMISNLDALGATGLPIQVTELDIDGPTDEVQLEDYQRIFPAFWEHPSVTGITLWGWKPGHWRTAQGAYLALENGAERPALVWLRAYVNNNAPVASLTATPLKGFVPLTVSFDASGSTDADEEDQLTYAWDFGDGTTATGVTVEHTYTSVGDFTATLTVTDELEASSVASATISVVSPLKVQYKVRQNEKKATDNHIRPFFRIVNVSNTAVPYKDLVIRYWYTREYETYFWASDNSSQQFWVDYAALGRNKITGTFVALDDPVAGGDHYLEVSFTTAELLAAGANSGEIQTRFNNANWSDYDETDDYSYDPSKREYADWEKVTLYQKMGDGSLLLIWGTEPAGVSNARISTQTPDTSPAEAATTVASDRWKVYPNPSPSGRFTVEADNAEAGERAVLQLIDFEGKEILTREMHRRLDMENQPLEPGIYFIRITGRNHVTVKKLKVE